MLLLYNRWLWSAVTSKTVVVLLKHCSRANNLYNDDNSLSEMSLQLQIYRSFCQ